MLTIENNEENFSFNVTIENSEQSVTHELDHFQTVATVMEYVKGRIKEGLDEQDE